MVLINPPKKLGPKLLKNGIEGLRVKIDKLHLKYPHTFNDIRGVFEGYIRGEDANNELYSIL